MALIKCKECNHIYDENKVTCPNCACPTTFNKNNKSENIRQFLFSKKLYVIVFGLIIVTVFLLFKSGNKVNLSNSVLNGTVWSDSKEITVDEFTVIFNKALKENLYFVSSDDDQYIRNYLPDGGGFSMDNWFAVNNFNKTNALIIDNNPTATGINTELSRKILTTILPELYEIKDNGVYVIDNEGTLFIYVKTNIDDSKDYIDFLFNNSEFKSHIFLLSTPTRDIDSVDIKKILDSNKKVVINKPLVLPNNLTNDIETVRNIVKANFSESCYGMSEQEQVEYLRKYLQYCNGGSISHWLDNGIYENTNTILIDDYEVGSWSPFTDPLYAERMKAIVPEVYEVEGNSINVIIHENIIYVYIKAISDDFKKYVDYMFNGSDFETPISVIQSE